MDVYTESEILDMVLSIWNNARCSCVCTESVGVCNSCRARSFRADLCEDIQDAFHNLHKEDQRRDLK